LSIDIRKDIKCSYVYWKPLPRRRGYLCIRAHRGAFACCTYRYHVKLRDRYPHLRNPATIKAMVVRSVYASMALENQAVPMERLETLYQLTEPAPAITPAAEAAR
jgi:hypothetical protein